MNTNVPTHMDLTPVLVLLDMSLVQVIFWKILIFQYYVSILFVLATFTGSTAAAGCHRIAVHSPSPSPNPFFFLFISSFTPPPSLPLILAPGEDDEGDGHDPRLRLNLRPRRRSNRAGSGRARRWGVEGGGRGGGGGGGGGQSGARRRRARPARAGVAGTGPARTKFSGPGRACGPPESVKCVAGFFV